MRLFLCALIISTFALHNKKKKKRIRANVPPRYSFSLHLHKLFTVYLLVGRVSGSSDRPSLLASPASVKSWFLSSTPWSGRSSTPRHGPGGRANSSLLPACTPFSSSLCLSSSVGMYSLDVMRARESVCVCAYVCMSVCVCVCAVCVYVCMHM